jgi:hypothetical protein
MKFTGGENTFSGGNIGAGFNTAIFIGVDQIKNGSFVAKFKMCVEKEEGLVPIDFEKQVFLTIYSKENPDPYKLDTEIINQMYEAMGLANRIQPGQQVELPGVNETIPEELSTPIKVWLVQDKKQPTYLNMAQKDSKWFWNIAEGLPFEKPAPKSGGSDLL